MNDWMAEDSLREILRILPALQFPERYFGEHPVDRRERHFLRGRTRSPKRIILGNLAGLVLCFVVPAALIWITLRLLFGSTASIVGVAAFCLLGGPLYLKYLVPAFVALTAVELDGSAIHSWVGNPRLLERRARTLHRQGVRKLRDVLPAGRPFILYLRDFALEATVSRKPGFTVTELGGGEFGNSMRRAVENLSSPERPVIIVANPNDLWMLPEQTSLYYVFLDYSGWKGVARHLINVAPVVLVATSSGGRGVQWELECVRDAGRESNLILISQPDNLQADTTSRDKATVTFRSLQSRLGISDDEVYTSFGEVSYLKWIAREKQGPDDDFRKLLARFSPSTIEDLSERVNDLLSSKPYS